MITKTVNEFLTNSLPNLNIAVIGDVMVDRYVFGDVSRISPEAPVPVNRVSSVKEVLGGAGNVASNLANLDCGSILSYLSLRLHWYKAQNILPCPSSSVLLA